MERIVPKRTSIKREKLPPLMERYLQVLEKKVPRSEWRIIFDDDLVFNGARGKHIHGFDAVTRQIEQWHAYMDRISVDLIRMVDHLDELIEPDGQSIHTTKMDFRVNAIWVNGIDPIGLSVMLPVIAMYESIEGKITRICEMWPRNRIPPTVG